MASSNYTEWFPAQTAQLSSLDSTLTSDSLQPTNFSLPAILEEDWGFGWGEDSFTESDPYAVLGQDAHAVTESDLYAVLGQDAHAVTESAPDLAAPPQVSQDLINLQRQVEQLREEISELQVIFFERLEGLEKIVAAAQRYVNDLIPWSINVHEKYSKLLEVARRQEEGAAESAQASAA
jgi:hypothetical protein